MFTCPHCTLTFPTTFLRDRHITDYHRGVGMGWYEGPQNVVDDKTGKVELKALEHHLSATREKAEKNLPISNPIPAPMVRPPKEELKVPEGWKQLSDGSYAYRNKIYENITSVDSITVIVEAKLNQSHGNCMEHKYTKDLIELERLKQKEISLDSDLKSKVSSDAAYHKIAKELYDTQQHIKKITHDTKADEFHTNVLDEYYRYDIGTNENIKWMQEFMTKVISESQRLEENYKRHNK